MTFPGESTSVQCTLARVYKRGKESVVLRITVCKRALQSTKVKLRNITQNVPQTSGVVTASTRARE